MDGKAPSRRRPVILAVDDDQTVLPAIEHDLRERYGDTYRILTALSAASAFEVTQQLKRKSYPLALCIVDQRMPGQTGVEFLAQAKELYPHTKSVLLTAYSDTEAAIKSINDVGLDYYLLKPWDPPEEHLYPVVDDLLDDWRAGIRLPFDGIRVVGTLWSPATHAVKEFLARHDLPYQWLDADKNPQARALLKAQTAASPRFPVVFFPDGQTLVQPTLRQVAGCLGLQTQAKKKFYDLIIIGGGPAGLAASVYAASEGLNVVLIEREAVGGQAGVSSHIDNYFGFPQGVSGAVLTRRAVDHAHRFGVEILSTQEAVKLRVADSYRYVILDDGTELSGKSILIVTGVSVRLLDKPGIDRYLGCGVYYGTAYSEAAYYRSRPMVVVGGGNSAGQGAMFLARYAEAVHLVVRGDSLVSSMSKYLIDELQAEPQVAIHYRTEVAGVEGGNSLETVILDNHGTGRTHRLSAAALFIYIGASPRTDFVDGLIARDDRGFILTGQDLSPAGEKPRGWSIDRDPYLLETNIPGIFAAGDVRHGATNRVASAVGEGAVAVSLVHQYLKTV